MFLYVSLYFYSRFILCLVRFSVWCEFNQKKKKKLYSNDGIFRGVTSIKKKFLQFFLFGFGIK